MRIAILGIVAVFTSCCLPFTENGSLVFYNPAISYGYDRDTFLTKATTIIGKYHEYDDEKRERIASTIWVAGQVYEIDPYVLLGLFALESGFDSSVVSCKGAQGIGQFLPGTWEWISKEAGIPDSLGITSYEGGIFASAYYLYHLRRETGSLNEALRLYGGWPASSGKGQKYVDVVRKYNEVQ